MMAGLPRKAWFSALRKRSTGALVAETLVVWTGTGSDATVPVKCIGARPRIIESVAIGPPGQR
jgi:hypothetical protein